MTFERFLERLNEMRRSIFWLFPTAIFFIFFMGGDYFLDVYREWKMEGWEYFEEPIRLSSGDLPICGSKLQDNNLYMLPKYDIYVTYHAQLMKLKPDGSYIDVRGAVRDKTLMAYANDPSQDYETDFHEVKDGNLPVGTYHWRTIITFRSRTGQWETTSYRGNDFEAVCTPEKPAA